MNLAQRDQRLAFDFSAQLFENQLFEKKTAVTLDRSARVLLREAQIQRISAVDARHSAKPSREGVDQPAELLQLFGTQKLWLVSRRAIGHHGSMIPRGSGDRVIG